MIDLIIVLIIVFLAGLYIFKTIKKSIKEVKCTSCTGNCSSCNVLNNEQVENLKKRLIYIASKRAVLENDIILSDFVKNYAIKVYNPFQLIQLTEFLHNTDDITVMELIFKNKKPYIEKYQWIVDEIKNFCSKNYNN